MLIIMLQAPTTARALTGGCRMSGGGTGSSTPASAPTSQPCSLPSLTTPSRVRTGICTFVGRGDGNVKSGTIPPLFCYLWIILIIPRCFPASCCFSIQRLSVRGSSDGRGFGLILVTVIITGNTLTAPSRSIQPQTTT